MAFTVSKHASARCFTTARAPAPSKCRLLCRASMREPEQFAKHVAVATASAITALSLLGTAPAVLAEFRLPPIDNDPNRCERGFTGNTIGQANAVSDKTLDLRKCVYAGKNLAGKTLAGALMSDADLSNTNLQEAVLTKAYAVNANFSGADLTNAVVDRVDFRGANMSGAKFINAVVTGATFDDANLSNTVWEDALIGNEDVKRLCANTTLSGESRFQVGCRVGKAQRR